MTSTTGTTLVYDALDRLNQVVSGAGTKFLYEGQQIIAEYNESGALQRRYIPGPGLDNPYVWFEGTGTASSTARWLLGNAFGSIIAVGSTGAANTTLAINQYDEFGVGPTSNLGRFQYKGMTMIPELGLYDARARIYSQYLGRFMQPDPSGYSDGMNLYAFVHNAPVGDNDPTGLGGCRTSSTYVPGTSQTVTVDENGNLNPVSVDIGYYRTATYCEPPDPPAYRDDRGGGGRQPQGKPHHYSITTPTLCTPSEAFNSLKGAGSSAPGAPAAQEGFTARINLWGIESPNPISQLVNSTAMTITNTTLPGHVFYPGDVNIQVLPAAGNTSAISITGTGTSSDPYLNDAVGLAFFGAMASFTQTGCAAMHGAYVMPPG